MGCLPSGSPQSVSRWQAPRAPGFLDVRAVLPHTGQEWASGMLGRSSTGGWCGSDSGTPRSPLSYDVLITPAFCGVLRGFLTGQTEPGWAKLAGWPRTSPFLSLSLRTLIGIMRRLN